MLTLLLIAAAAYAVAGPDILAKIREAAGRVNLPQISGRHVVAAALVAAAALSWGSGGRREPTPAPPAPDVALDLRGKFAGPDAAADAATTSALLDELASEIEWDGLRPQPLIATGVAVDELRQRARELRCRGVSLGEKHPRAREAIKVYLDQAAGTSGAPLTPATRSQWVAAYRTVARAAADAAR